MIPDDCHDHIRSVCLYLSQIFLNGSDVTGNVTSNLSLTVPPLSSTLLTISHSTPVSPGNLCTVVLQYVETGAGESVAGGRWPRPTFPLSPGPRAMSVPFLL